ncbi:MAG: glycosyltransferase family 4 protein [Candidatus Lokiarchaeia archaeon]
MKILQICPKFHPSIASGSTKIAYNISKELARRGHSVTVYTSDMKDKYTRINNGIERIDGISVHRFQSIGTFATREIKFFIIPKIIPTLKNEVGSFDIVHIHESRSFQNIFAYHYTKKYDIPYVLQAHGTITENGRRNGIKWLYDVLFGYKILRAASKTIALNRTETEHYKKAGVVENKIEIIPNGINPSEYRLPPKGEFKTKYEIGNDEKVVLYLGRIHRSKGIDLLINSFAILEKIINNVKLALVGPDDGFLKEALQLSKKLRSKILFTGFVSEEEKLKALVDADVLVIPSFYGFPITFLEACIAGVPIVTTSIGDNLSWIDGKVGFIRPPTSKDLSEGIYQILTNKKIYEKFSRNCKNIVHKEFSIDKITSKLENLYRSIIH